MSDCTHDWLRPGDRLNAVYIIDDWQGPTDAILECSTCGTYALLRLLYWSGRNLGTRICTLAGLDNEAVGIFLRNMKSAYCDLSRHGAETDMLIATATGTTSGVILSAPEMRVLASLDVAELGDRKPVSWRRQSPDDADPYWHEVLAGYGIDSHHRPSTEA